MKKILVIVFLFFALLEHSHAQQQPRPQSEDTDVTVITSESLIYDSENQSAVFEQDVVVTDPRIKLMSDKLAVQFDEDNKVKFIQADGNVYIEQDDKTAWAESASYDLLSGKIVLVGDPIIRQGRDMLQGEKITFWRDETRMICEPNARLTIFSQDDQVRSQIKGKQ